MTTLTYGLKAPDDGDNSSLWFPALRANFVAIDAHTHNGVNSPLISINNVSPLTTKGDLMVFSSGASTRIAVGTDGHILTADSTQTSGIKWAAAANSPDSSYEITNLTLAASVSSNALTISVKQKDGSNPASGSGAVKIGFRSSTAATGTYNQRTVTSALSMVVSSGSTLGHQDGVAQYIYVYAIDNAGTVELAVSSALLDEGSRQSTTAEGGAGAADSNRVAYSTTARTNVGIRLIGRMSSSQTTAGTWAAVPTEISLPPFAIQNVQANYVTAAGQSINSGSATVVDFGSKLEDTTNSVATGASWAFTAPEKGTYLVSAQVVFASNTFTAGTNLSMQLFANGALRSYLGGVFTVWSSTSQKVWLGGSEIVRITAAGNTIQIKLEQNEGAARSLTSDGDENLISIVKIGDI